MLSNKKAVAKAPAPKKATPGPAPAHPKSDPKKVAPKPVPKAAPKATKKPAGAKPVVKKSIKKDIKQQKARQHHRVKAAKNIEKTKEKPAKKGKNKEIKAVKATKKPVGAKPVAKKSIKAEIKKQKARQHHRIKAAVNIEKTKEKPAKKGKNKEVKALPHPKKNLKLALKGKSNGGKVGNNLDYSKLVVDALHKYHELIKAEKKKDMKKVNTLKEWVKKNAHMDLKKFMDRFKSGAKKIKIEVLTKGASQSKHHMPKELSNKLDKDDDMEDELHKFEKGEAKGRTMPEKIRETLKKIKGGKITDTKIGHIGGYHYLFVYVHQNAP